ncbi:MAG: DUF5020 family protein [Paludibacteraceae bacterium]
MKKILLAISLFLSPVAISQNFQLHHDFGKDRNYLTSTFEMFRPDNWGNTFLFIDFDYNFEKERHPSMAYMELARCFTLGKSPLSFQIEYNGGLLASGTTEGSFFYPINNAYLAGIDYGWHSQDFNKFLNFKMLYKYISEKNPISFQLTATWDLNFYNKKLTLSGFADFWREDNVNYYSASGEEIVPVISKFVLVSEPQFWYNLTSHFSLGSEIEFGINFGTVQGLKVCPTVGGKWIF